MAYFDPDASTGATCCVERDHLAVQDDVESAEHGAEFAQFREVRGHVDTGPRPASDVAVVVAQENPVKSALDIWGRPDDKWRMVDAARIDGGVVVKLIDHFDQGTAELQIDTRLKVPVRWTRLYSVFGGVTSQKLNWSIS
ncbi:hypothetical protein L5G32_18510 [Gordonia sp. HY002]|uniref:hypothetical protein n=1 Tax=Gordonia zhenghanii TaxID=2911516 RepID=UPI001EF050E6|nr:hypothetical protein [Gordonia zhenghanii]MCF8572256.1 hypothetical protein [Gordonia zhenghanii]MCF8607581.1 hypothetical protein [Gordonia zhenghanii]